MPSHPTVSVDELMQQSDRFLQHRLRRVRYEEFQAHGIPLPRPTLERQSNADLMLSFGQQALDDDKSYLFAGCADGRTLVFVDEKTQQPLQIFRSELPGTVFFDLGDAQS